VNILLTNHLWVLGLHRPAYAGSELEVEQVSSTVGYGRIFRMANPPEMQIDTNTFYDVTIETSKGNIVMELDPELAPNTVNNFVSLAKEKYYDGIIFHRVVPEFVIQGGDPTGTGTGGPGYKFADEPVKGEYVDGSVAMANAGPDTNGSQFFICIDDCTRKLTPNYNLFGIVTEGLDVAKSIAVGDEMKTVTVTERPKG
jgi:peptidyl-prolyl cis-trans isomerase B (cyclophilin B)